MEDVAAIKAARKARRRFLVQFAVGCTSFVLCVLLYAPQFSMLTASYHTTTTRLDADDYSTAEEVLLVDDGGGGNALPPRLDLDNQVGSPCSSMPEHGICCDRSDANADVCFMTGDVRTDPTTSLSLLLFPPPTTTTADDVAEERIRPYTRKWDPAVTKRIHEVTLRAARPDEAAWSRRHCDVVHDAPAHVVTAGGYNAGNYFHAFNDGFLPAWITTQHLLLRRRGGVVLAVLAYDQRWADRHAEVLAGLSSSSASAHQIIDLVNDNRTHCFPGAIVGTRFHGYLAVDPARLRDNKTILDFHDFLAHVYTNKNPPASQQHRGRLDVPRQQQQNRRPRLGIVSRRGTRVIENEAAVARLAARVGFDVDVIEAGKEEAHRQLTLPALHAEVSGLDALVGAHGSDLTSLLFLRPGRAALVQVAPLGVTGLARGLFGVPAQRMGLRYEQYDARGHESSLSRVYAPDHVVVADPERAKRNKKGGGDGLDWEFIGRVYLTGQNVTLDLARFGETLARVHSWVLEQRQREESGSA
ncbi:hypothetical protein PR202_gb26754 [Eleusine coracana subsp. coracana]|uniref:Glycosyltransferase 61 catalytic domain-containing protein n=1 Tax=Eleusine coracana subsp. coracana TaxID=191504 RepID=A0AAV5FRY6_ELECO|nr:hypothetical protein PR202_gb26754 [Eleusine coracana subsp. coracana]